MCNPHIKSNRFNWKTFAQLLINSIHLHKANESDVDFRYATSFDLKIT